MTFTGMKPEGVRALADRIAVTADRADGLALDIERALYDSGLTSTTPVSIHELAAGLEQTSSVLRARADKAQGLVLDFALYTALARVARSVTLVAPACARGPSTIVGSSSPCDPVQSIRAYTLAAGAYIPIVGLAGIKLDGAYILRVEHLRSGKLRVTRIEEAALGVAWGVGADTDIHAGKFTTTSGASAQAWVQLLLARGTSYEIEGSDLDEFIATDILDLVTQRFAFPGSVASLGVFKGVAKKVVGFADHLPIWKLHGVVSGLRKRLNWARPKPLSSFTEVGFIAGSTAGLGLDFLPPLPVKGKAGLSISGRVVVGVERREAEQTLYMDMRTEIGTPLSYRLFGIDLSKLGAVDTRIGLVRDAVSGEFDRIEFTVITENGKNIERRTAVIDLTDPATHPAAQRLVDGLTNLTQLPDSIDALEKLLGHRVTTEQTTMRRISKSTYGITGYGNGGKFIVEELDVR